MTWNTLKPRLKKKNLSKKNKQIKISESSARDWRFQCLARLYLDQQYTFLLTGHTATDRMETVLLKLIRGTSLNALTSFKINKIYKSVYPKYFNYSIFFNII